ncbi:hypothetical protein Q0O45_13500, partial [Staphylococcus aureus]|nr:hypothetical protein [Staphylococcus aureus]
HGLSLHATHGWEAKAFDALLVPGFWAESAAQIEAVLGANAALIKALTLLDRSKRLWGYCTGVCLLAASGKLNGQPATVTWWA